jgi:hypothetical protein
MRSRWRRRYCGAAGKRTSAFVSSLTHTPVNSSGNLLMKISPRYLGRSRQSTDNNVDTGCMGRQNVTTYRTQTTPHQIAGDGVAYGLRDDKTKACGFTGRPGMEIDNRVSRTHALTPPYGSAKIIRTDHPVRPGEHRVLLRGKLGATLAATCSQDRAAGTGTHTKTEAVHLGATTVVRLESSLAHSGISKAQL